MFLPEVALYTHGHGDTVIFKAQKLMVLRNRSHRDEASTAGYRILHLILCLGSVPDSLPSALAQGVLSYLQITSRTADRMLQDMSHTSYK